jgi:hypothetical protein
MAGHARRWRIMTSPAVTRTARVVAFIVLVVIEWVLIRFVRLDWVAAILAASAASLISGLMCTYLRPKEFHARSRHHPVR